MRFSCDGAGSKRPKQFLPIFINFCVAATFCINRFRRGYPFATASINVTRMICMLFNLVNKYGARQAYDTIKVSFWHLLLDPDTDHFRSVAIASPPAGSESVSLSEQSEQRGRGAALEGTAHAANGARQSEAGTGSNSANQPQHTTVHRKSRRQEQPVHLRQHINACLHPVHELYCTAFVLLDRNFRKADALNMEFNLILEQTYAEMEAAMRFVRAPRAFGNVQPAAWICTFNDDGMLCCPDRG